MRNISLTSKAIKRSIEALGFRVGVAEDDGLWIATAKRDRDGAFHVARADSEARVMAELAQSTGLEIEET